MLAIKRDGESVLLTEDDVYEKDLQTFNRARKTARQHGVTVRYAMENRDKDQRFQPIIAEMYETVRLENIGRIRRITGAPNFDVTHHETIKLDDISRVIIFSDGVAPLNIDIHTEEGQKRFIGLMNEKGLEGLYEEIEKAAREDPDFERYPRFRDIDDILILQIAIK